MICKRCEVINKDVNNVRHNITTKTGFGSVQIGTVLAFNVVQITNMIGINTNRFNMIDSNIICDRALIPCLKFESKRLYQFDTSVCNWYQ